MARGAAVFSPPLRVTFNGMLMALRTRANFARLDKLKHVPQCAARKLSAVSFQHSAFE
jgi:hypothetical protein